jgi:NAD-dependent deacetylase
MTQPSADEGTRVVVLSGAGLSQASGIPTFRDSDGLWQGRSIQDVATPEGWHADRELVRTFYDQRRIACAQVLPNPGHEALARLQHALGVKRCTLVTQNIDGLLQKASAADVIEMHGSLWRLRCERDSQHPLIGVYGPQNRDARCSICEAMLRPDVVWFGELPSDMEGIHQAVATCDVFMSIGTSGVVYPAAGLVRIAKSGGARTIEVNPKPSGGLFDEVIEERAEEALPRLIGRWLNEEQTRQG